MKTKEKIISTYVVEFIISVIFASELFVLINLDSYSEFMNFNKITLLRFNCYSSAFFMCNNIYYI